MTIMLFGLGFLLRLASPAQKALARLDDKSPASAKLMDNLEVELASELQLARIARRGDLAGCAQIGRAHV